MEDDPDKQSWDEDGNVGIPGTVFRQIEQFVKQNEAKEKYIFDTKWKLIKDMDKDVSQGDIYQMYAYGKKYSANHLCLIYPKNEEFKISSKEKYFYDKKSMLPLSILCFDCENDKFIIDYEKSELFNIFKDFNVEEGKYVGLCPSLLKK